MDWNQVIAATINAVVVLMVVQFLKVKGLPWLNKNVPWVLPLVAMLVGSLATMLADYLAALLGYPIDLSPIVGLFSGGTAVALHQVGRQYLKAG